MQRNVYKRWKNTLAASCCPVAMVTSHTTTILRPVCVTAWVRVCVNQCFSVCVRCVQGCLWWSGLLLTGSCERGDSQGSVQDRWTLFNFFFHQDFSTQKESLNRVWWLWTAPRLCQLRLSERCVGGRCFHLLWKILHTCSLCLHVESVFISFCMLEAFNEKKHTILTLMSLCVHLRRFKSPQVLFLPLWWHWWVRKQTNGGKLAAFALWT